MNIKDINKLPRIDVRDLAIENLQKRVDYLESVLSEIQIFNSLGKTLRINEAIEAALNE
jgi:hypothetical protein